MSSLVMLYEQVKKLQCFQYLGITVIVLLHHEFLQPIISKAESIKCQHGIEKSDTLKRIGGIWR